MEFNTVKFRKQAQHCKDFLKKKGKARNSLITIYFDIFFLFTFKKYFLIYDIFDKFIRIKRL